MEAGCRNITVYPTRLLRPLLQLLRGKAEESKEGLYSNRGECLAAIKETTPPPPPPRTGPSGRRESLSQAVAEVRVDIALLSVMQYDLLRL